MQNISLQIFYNVIFIWHFSFYYLCIKKENCSYWLKLFVTIYISMSLKIIYNYLLVQYIINKCCWYIYLKWQISSSLLRISWTYLSLTRLREQGSKTSQGENFKTFACTFNSLFPERCWQWITSLFLSWAFSLFVILFLSCSFLAL